MREIKFRAWDGKRMLNRTLHDRNWYTEDDKCVKGAMPHDVNILKIMQYTGLKDKNGKEIYEGDIVKAHYFFFNSNFDNDGEIIGEVIYSDWCTYGISTLENDKSEPEWLDFDDTSHFEEPCLEIIGNIYENPDLL